MLLRWRAEPRTLVAFVRRLEELLRRLLPAAAECVLILHHSPADGRTPGSSVELRPAADPTIFMRRSAKRGG